METIVPYRVVSGVLLKDKEVLDAKIADLQKKAIAPADQSEAIRRYVYEFNREQHVAIREKSCQSLSGFQSASL